MNNSIKFDVKKLAKLNNTERFKMLNPDVIWGIFNLKNNAIIIDIGAGTGFFAKEFAKKIPNGKLFAADSSKMMIEWMKTNLDEKNITPILCSESEVPLDDEIAELIYTINVHHELLEPEKFLKEALRLLKPNGKIAVIDWKKTETKDGPPIEKRISEETIKNQLINVNFNNITSYTDFHCHTFILGEKL